MDERALTGFQPEKAGHAILAGGLATTAGTLFGLHWIESNDIGNPMGFYVNYVLPLGAVAVGALAGSGYGLGSWCHLLAVVLVLQVAAYGGARYLEFRALDARYEDGTPVSFLTWVDITSRSFTWTQKDGKQGEPLGIWGYFFRLLEVVGFVGGGLIIPAILRNHPYCDACQRYLSRRNLGLLPAGVAPRKIKKKDTAGAAALDQDRKEAMDRGGALLQELVTAVQRGDGAATARLLEPHAKVQGSYAKLEGRLSLTLSTCQGCGNGFLEAGLVQGQGQQIRNTPFGRWDVLPAFVASFPKS